MGFGAEKVGLLHLSGWVKMTACTLSVLLGGKLVLFQMRLSIKVRISHELQGMA